MRLRAPLALLALAAAGLPAASLPAAPAPACGPVVFNGAGEPQLLLASDLPLERGAREQTAQMAKAIAYVLQRHGFEAGRFTLGYRSCDDAAGRGAPAAPATCAANAAAFAADPRLVGVIGPFDSACAAAEIPVLNRAPAGPLALVSPANTYTGLTRSAPGTAAGEPGLYYPTGKRNYVRLVAADDVQAAADAQLARRLGVHALYLLDDGSVYGTGMAANVRAAAPRAKVAVAGAASWQAPPGGLAALAAAVASAKADGAFLAGVDPAAAGRVIRVLRARLGPDFRILVPYGLTPVAALVRAAGAAAEGVTVSAAGLPNGSLRGAGRLFLAGLAARLGKEPDPYAVYAAQAAELLVHAIATTTGTRAAVTAALLRAEGRDGILGPFRITPSGDLARAPVAIYRIEGGRSLFSEVIVAAPPPAPARP